MLLFVGATVVQAIAATVSSIDLARNLSALGGVATGIGWLLVVRAAFAIGKSAG